MLSSPQTIPSRKRPRIEHQGNEDGVSIIQTLSPSAHTGETETCTIPSVIYTVSSGSPYINTPEWNYQSLSITQEGILSPLPGSKTLQNTLLCLACNSNTDTHANTDIQQPFLFQNNSIHKILLDRILSRGNGLLQHPRQLLELEEARSKEVNIWPNSRSSSPSTVQQAIIRRPHGSDDDGLSYDKEWESPLLERHHTFGSDGSQASGYNDSDRSFICLSKKLSVPGATADLNSIENVEDLSYPRKKEDPNEIDVFNETGSIGRETFGTPSSQHDSNSTSTIASITHSRSDDSIDPEFLTPVAEISVSRYNDDASNSDKHLRQHFLTVVGYNANIATANAQMMKHAVEGIYNASTDNISQSEPIPDFLYKNLILSNFVSQPMLLPHSSMNKSHFEDDIAIASLMFNFDDTIQDCDADQHVFEQEKQISIVIEPSCMEMKQVISCLKPILMHDHGDESHDGNPMERWYAQTSVNIDGIYYYQPSTGDISRTIPPSYMDTSDVRRYAEIKIKARRLCALPSLSRKNFYSIDADYEFVRLVSPMKQKTIDHQLKSKQPPNFRTLLGRFGLALLFTFTIYMIIVSAQNVSGELVREPLGNPKMFDLKYFDVPKRRNGLSYFLLPRLTNTCIVTEYSCIC